jgi:hypothetical protein
LNLPHSAFPLKILDNISSIGSGTRIAASSYSGSALNLPHSAFPLKILDNISSIGSGTRIAASSYRGSALNKIKIENLYNYFK